MSQILREAQTKVIESRDSKTERVQTTNLVSVSQIQLKRFRTRAIGTFFYKLNNDTTI